MFIQPMHAREETLIIAPNGDVVSVIMTEHRSSLDEPLVGLNAPANYMILRGRYNENLQTFLNNTQFYQLSNRNEVIAAASKLQALAFCQQQGLPDDTSLIPLADIMQLPCYGPIVRSWFSRATVPFMVTVVMGV